MSRCAKERQRRSGEREEEESRKSKGRAEEERRKCEERAEEEQRRSRKGAEKRLSNEQQSFYSLFRRWADGEVPWACESVDTHLLSIYGKRLLDDRTRRRKDGQGKLDRQKVFTRSAW